MVLEEAIDILKWDINYGDGKIKDAINVAIKALEQELCEDAVSREEVMENYNGVETPVGYRKVVDMEVIKNMQSVYPKAKTGHWIVNKEKDTICCSCCNDKQKIGKDEVELLDTAFTGFRFCRYCGSDNREVEV